MPRPFGILLALCLAPIALGAAPAATATVQEARGFTLEYREGYKLVRVKSPWPGSSRAYTYLLYPRGAPRPAGVPADLALEVPLRRVVTFSTTYLAQISALGAAASVVGVDNADSIYDEAIRARLDSGAAREIARSGQPDLERIVALAPDAIFAYGMGNEWDVHPKLQEAGLPVILDGDWNEASPLGRAEWIKFIAAFYDLEAEATARFERSRAEYRRLAALAARAPERPAVLLDGPYQGSWNVAGGASYMATLIAAAGGSYLWAEDRSTGSLVLSVEAAFDRGRRAQVWLNPGLQVRRIADILAQDPRFAALPVLSSGEVWNSTLRVNGRGGNDYYESAVIRPEAVLADLIKIFHPELLRDRPFTYYRKLGR